MDEVDFKELQRYVLRDRACCRRALEILLQHCFLWEFNEASLISIYDKHDLPEEGIRRLQRTRLVSKQLETSFQQSERSSKQPLARF